MTGVRAGGTDITRAMNAGQPLSRIVCANDTLWAAHSISIPRDGGYYSESGRSSWSISFSAGSDKQVGDLVLVFVSVDGGRTVTANSADWQRLVWVTGDPVLAVFAHLWDGQSKTLTLSWGATEDVAVTVQYLRDTTRTLSEIQVSPAAAGSGSQVDMPAFTPAAGSREYMWMLAVSSASQPISTAPDGWGGYTGSTGTASSDAGIGHLFRKSRAATMDVPPFALAGSGAAWRAVLLAIPPRTV